MQKIYMGKTDVYMEKELPLITAITALKPISTSLCLMEQYVMVQNILL